MLCEAVWKTETTTRPHWLEAFGLRSYFKLGVSVPSTLATKAEETEELSPSSTDLKGIDEGGGVCV